MIARKEVVAWQGEPLEFGRRVHAEAQRRGLAQAQAVFVVADGSVWIWNVQADRFGGAHGVLDFYHASQHLWTVAHALHPGDEAAARSWVEPLLSQLRHGQEAKVLQTLEDLPAWCRQAQRAVPPEVARKRRIFSGTANMYIMRRGGRRAVRRAAGRWNPPARSCGAVSSGAASPGVVPGWGTAGPGRSQAQPRLERPLDPKLDTVALCIQSWIESQACLDSLGGASYGDGCVAPDSCSLRTIPTTSCLA